MEAERNLEQAARWRRGLRCARYVARWAKYGGPCDRDAIAVADGVPVCYVHAPVPIREALRDLWDRQARGDHAGTDWRDQLQHR